MCPATTYPTSLSDEVQGDHLLRLAELPHLHPVCLWFSLQKKFEDHTEKLKELSDNRIKVSFSASMSSLWKWKHVVLCGLSGVKYYGMAGRFTACHGENDIIVNQ